MQCSFEVLMHFGMQQAGLGALFLFAAQALRTSESRRGGSAACLIKPPRLHA